MSYTPTSWSTGDVVTSEKLNNMEDGISSACPVLNVALSNEGASDKTWKQIKDACDIGMVIIRYQQESAGEYINYNCMYVTSVIDGVVQGVHTYMVVAISGNIFVQLVTDSENGYPVAMT